MARIKEVNVEQLMPAGLDYFTAEASEIGFAPGELPGVIRVTARNPRNTLVGDFGLSAVFSLSGYDEFLYRDGKGRAIKVFND